VVEQKVVLTIGGSDPCAGAGIQADLKTLAAFGIYGTVAVTAITVQNTCGVLEVYSIPGRLVERQIDGLVEDLDVAACKTGMLGSRDVAEAVAGKLASIGTRRLVVDPVMRPGICDEDSGGVGDGCSRETATGEGCELLSSDALTVVMERIFPLASVVTPNLTEAETLSGLSIDSVEAMEEAARRIHALGPACVVVKGGHLPGESALDLFFDGRSVEHLEAGRQGRGPYHGTGCVFSAAIAAGLAQQRSSLESVREAKSYVSRVIKRALRLGRGSYLLDHLAGSPESTQPSHGGRM